MEFVMTTDIETALPAEIGFNFDELKTELTERLEYYSNLVITEDGVKEGKADLAKLRKLKDAIETRRKEIKKQCMKPYTAFETKVKELTALIDEPVATIDKQLKAFEERRKEEKMQQIEASYNSLVSDTIKDIIPLERILGKTWLNATVSIAKVEDEIIQWTKRVNADIFAMDTVDPEYKAAVRAKYIETLDVAAALDHQRALQEAKRAFEATSIPPQVKAEKPAVTPTADATEATEAPKLYALRLEFHLTKEQANALKEFLTREGIEHIKI